MARGTDAVSGATSAIVLVVDHLRAAYLGCYGNAWVPTPALNRLAATGFVFDEAHAAGPELAEHLGATWGDQLVERLNAHGVHTALLTDDSDVAKAGAQAHFAEIVQLPSGTADHAADDIDETHLAQVFADASEWLAAKPSEPFLLWLHVGSLGQIWDAPRDLREQFLEEGDAPLLNFLAPPCRMLAEDFDPDERWGIALAYAAQVCVLDACVDALLAAIDESGLAGRTLCTLFGARGYPLGEHRRVGPVDHALYGEALHVPWIVRLPGAEREMERSSALTTLADLAATLTELFNLPQRDVHSNDGKSVMPLLMHDAIPWRERLNFHLATGEMAVRTPEWFLRVVPAGIVEPEHCELYAKPDDRWEVNDVHDRCADVVERLRSGAPN